MYIPCTRARSTTTTSPASSVHVRGLSVFLFSASSHGFTDPPASSFDTKTRPKNDDPAVSKTCFLGQVTGSMKPNPIAKKLMLLLFFSSELEESAQFRRPPDAECHALPCRCSRGMSWWLSRISTSARTGRRRRPSPRERSRSSGEMTGRACALT